MGYTPPPLQPLPKTPRCDYCGRAYDRGTNCTGCGAPLQRLVPASKLELPDTLFPPRPDTAAHKPVVTYINKSYAPPSDFPGR